MALLETVDLCQKYGERDTLKNINLKIERGEVFTVIGPTGAGKTTLLRLLDFLDVPTDGRIYFDGIDTATSERVRLEIRRRITFVLQKPVVFNTSVDENIAYALKWRGMKSNKVRHKVENTLEMVGLLNHKDRNARTLSGGEVQRVAIARAIVSEPELLLLDEPTANLDPISAVKIEELITKINQQYSTTIIMASHDFFQGQRLANRVAVLSNGEIQQSGDWVTIFSSPKNREVANFVGIENIIPGTIAASQDKVVTIDVGGKIIEAISDNPVGEKVYVCIRAEDITLALTKLPSSARNAFAGRITRLISFGPLARLEIDCSFPLTALITKRSAEELELNKGKQVYASFKATAVHVIKR